ncbi:MAG: hypothetical protein AAF933_13360 [Pseudomonadota bacterium]
MAQRPILLKLMINLISLLPWAASLFVQYWLEINHVWKPEMPMRDAASLLLLLGGMGLSFILHSYLTRPGRAA